MTLDASKILTIFKNKFSQFNNSHEQDAHEAFLCVIDLLEKARPSIKDYIYGTIQKTVIFPGGKSVTEEQFAVLMLTPHSDSKLEDLLRDHFKQEVLTDYIDDSGKEHHCAVIEQKISKFPPVFIIGFTMFQRKFMIEISDKMGKYNLFSMCTHVGSARGGHYVAHTKHRGIWYLKDDNNVINNVQIPLAGPFYFCLFKSTNS